MARNRNKPYVCRSCRMIFRGKATTPCPNCGSKETERLIGASDRTPDAGPPEPAPSSAPNPPAVPRAPPMPPVRPARGPGVGGGAITPEMLRGVRLRRVVRQGPVVPGPPQSPIPFGVRLLAASIRNPCIPFARFSRPAPRDRRMYHLPDRANHSLSGPLSSIANGRVNPDHGKFNTGYRNRGGDLPTLNNPFDRIRAQYFEYGWWTIVPQNLWLKWLSDTGRPAPDAVAQQLGGFLRADGGKTDLERLIFAATGEVFYTPDHYLTFWRYSFKLMEWSKYLSPAARYGSVDPDWDASIYFDVA